MSAFKQSCKGYLFERSTCISHPLPIRMEAWGHFDSCGSKQIHAMITRCTCRVST